MNQASGLQQGQPKEHTNKTMWKDLLLHGRSQALQWVVLLHRVVNPMYNVISITKNSEPPDGQLTRRAEAQIVLKAASSERVHSAGESRCTPALMQTAAVWI